MADGTAAADSTLIGMLAGASDAPAYQGGAVKRCALPAFYRNWCRTAWADLLGALPDEDQAELGENAPAREEFRRLVRAAMLGEIVLGDIIKANGATQTERRSLIGWCQKFAKPGPWRRIGDKQCWCKVKVMPDGEAVLTVGICHDLFAQLRADRRLCEMNTNTFTRRAERYGVGKPNAKERPHGQRAIILDADFVRELVAEMPQDEEE